MAVNLQTLKIYFSLNRDLIPLKKTGKNFGKAPLHNDWTNRQYTKEEIIDYAKKQYNIGWRLGQSDFVIDIDPKNGGKKSFKNFLKNHLNTEFLKFIYQYPTVRTGSGGYHIYMRLPYRLRTREVLKEYPGIEFKTFGRQVVIPGSVHPITGDEYRFFPLTRKKEQKILPIKILPLLKYQINGKMRNSDVIEVTPKQLAKILKSIPVEEYREQADWFTLMASAHQATGGNGIEEFVAWSISDPHYADHDNIIRQRWQSLKTDRDNLVTTNTLLQQYQLHAPNDFKNYAQYNARQEFKDISPKSIKKKILSKDIPEILSNFILEKKFENGKHIINASDQQFWQFAKTHWKPIPDNMMLQIIHDSMEEYRALNKNVEFAVASNIKNTELVLKARTATDFDLFRIEKGLPSVINTRNKEIWIDEKTSELSIQDHRYDNYLISCLEVEYDPLAKCDFFIQTLNEIFSEEDNPQEIIDFLFELFGYFIQPNKNIPIWVLLVGLSASNGKTVCLQILSALCGKAALNDSIRNLNTAKSNFAFAKLPGKLAVIDEDLPMHTLLPDDILKKISENKPLTAEPKFGKEFTFMNQAAIIMASNSWPQTSDLSNGMKRRAIVIPFERQFTKDEIDLDRAKKIIKTELSGILNKCLDGLQRLRKRGRFEIPKSCKKAIKNWFYDSNPTNTFLDDHYKKIKTQKLPQNRLKHAKVSFNEIWLEYQNFVITNSLRNPLSKIGLSKVLKQLGFKIKNSTGNKRYVFGIKKRQKE